MTKEEQLAKRWHLHLTHNKKKFTNDAYVNDPLNRMKSMKVFYQDYCPITIEDKWSGKVFVLEEFEGYENKVKAFVNECNRSLSSPTVEYQKELYKKIYCKKLYEIIFVDEYENFINLGFYKDLNDAIEDINEQLKEYGNGKYKLEKGEVKASPSTFGECFDLDIVNHFIEKLGENFEEEINEDLHGVAIRGFIYELTEEDYKALCKVFALQ